MKNVHIEIFEIFYLVFWQSQTQFETFGLRNENEKLDFRSIFW